MLVRILYRATPANTHPPSRRNAAENRLNSLCRSSHRVSRQYACSTYGGGGSGARAGENANPFARSPTVTIQPPPPTTDSLCRRYGPLAATAVPVTLYGGQDSHLNGNIFPLTPPPRRRRHRSQFGSYHPPVYRLRRFS